MKKIIITLISILSVVTANASNINSILSITGSVTPGCTQSLSISSLSFSFLANAKGSSQQFNLVINCSAGTVISGLTAQSTNGWQFKGLETGSTLNYALNFNDIASQYSSYSTSFISTWSSYPGTTTPNSVLTSPITINANADALTINLALYPAQASAKLPVDTFSDTLTFTSTF